MYKKLGAVVLALVLVLALALTGCSSGSNSSSSTSSSGGTIKIGANYELSGAVASYGSDSLKGLKMAIDEVNASGGVLGKKLQIVSKDNQSNPSQAMSIEESLMSQDKVAVVAGPATSGGFQACIPVAERHGIPIISSSATSDKNITLNSQGKVNSEVFRTCFTDSYQGKVMADFASKKLNAKTAVVYADNSSDYGKGLSAAFQAQFKKDGGTIIAVDAYMSGDQDFNAVLTSLKAKPFDVMFVPGYYQEAGLIIKQARALGMNQPILGADGFDSPQLAQIAGAANANKIYYSDHYSSLDKSTAVQNFIKDYKGKNGGQQPSAFVAMGYDLGKYIAATIKRAGTTDPKKLTDAFASTQNFSGVTGTFSVSSTHDVIKSAVVIEMENGNQVSVTRMTAQ